MSRCVLIQTNASKKRFNWFDYAQKEEFELGKGREGEGREGKYTERNLQRKEKKKKKKEHENEWFDCDLTDVESLPYDKFDMMQRMTPTFDGRP